MRLVLYLVVVSHPNTLSCVCGGVIVLDLCENTPAPQPTGALVKLKLKYIDFRYSPQQKKKNRKSTFSLWTENACTRTYYIGHDLHDLLPRARMMRVYLTEESNCR